MRSSAFPLLRQPAGVAAAILIAGLDAPAARANDWATPGLDLAHTRLSGERSGTSFDAATWTASAASRTLAGAVVEDGFVVIADLDGVVRALRAETGELAWMVALGSAVQGTPALARGKVFVPTVSDVFFALRLADGAMLWQRDIGGMTLSSPTPIEGDVIVAPGFPQLNVVRLSGETGDLVWQSPSVMWQFSNTSPAVGGGLVVVGSQQGHYYAFDARTGAFRWEYIGDGTVNLATPMMLGGRVYMAGGDQSNRVHAVDAATGMPIAGWPINLPTPVPDIPGTRQGGWRAVSSFAAVGGLLLLQTRLDDALGPRASGPFNWLSREVVVALNPLSGALVWQHPLARAENIDVNNVPKFFVCPSPAAYLTDGGTALVTAASSLDAVVAVLDVASGTERARQPVAGAALASPVLANGYLFTTAASGVTQAFGSSVNQAPTAPVVNKYANPIDGANLTLGWSSAMDHEGEIPSYELRIDADGEILESWQRQVFVDAGATSARIEIPLAPEATYTFAVRARDPHGALSPWSAPGTFMVIATTGGTGPGTGTQVGTPQIPIMESDSMTNQPPGTGCSIGGATSDGGILAAVIISAVSAVRNRRRKRSS